MMEWIKEHPYLSGTLALVLVILILVFRRGSGQAQDSASRGGPSDSLQAAGIAAGVQLQSAQLAATYGISQINARTNEIELLSAADVTKTQLAQAVSLAQIAAGQEVTDAQTAAQLQLGLAAIGHQTLLPATSNGSNGLPNEAQPIVVSPSQFSPSFTPAPGSPNIGTPSGVYNPSHPLEQCGNLTSVGEQYACVQRNLANPNWGINPNAGVTSPSVIADYQRLFGPSGMNPAYGMPLDYSPYHTAPTPTPTPTPSPAPPAASTPGYNLPTLFGSGLVIPPAWSAFQNVNLGPGI